MQDQQQSGQTNPQLQEPHESRKWMRMIFMITMIVGSGMVLFIYGMYFNDLSETEMVNLSFVWIASLAFGFSGLEMEKRGKKLVLLKAFGFALLALFGLAFFFAAFWSAL